MANKKITLENLAKKIDKGFEKAEKYTDKKNDEKIDRLALAIKKGFDENTKQHQKLFDRLDKHGERLSNLEQGQEDIKLKLDQVAYKFEVQELDRRLKKIEAKLGLS